MPTVVGIFNKYENDLNSGEHDLGFTAPLGPKSMLAVVEDVMFLHVFYHVTHNDIVK